jgi:predicted dehydrogenase
MSSNTVSVGILGFAHGHVAAYCNRWRAEPELGVRVTAGWDHDASRAAAAGRTHGVELCDSPADLLRRSDVDAVVIAAETSRHAALADQAAEAGKAIVLQKPMALTVEQADRIVAAVEASGVPFTMAWQMRVDSQNVQMKSLLASGQFGRVFMVRRRHGLSTHLWEGFENTWHVDPAANRDIWADDAAHAIDFVFWLLGMPASVTAELGSLLNPKVPNDNGIAVFRYADGTFAEVVCSFTCAAAENTTEIVCENGSIIQNYGDAPSANVPRPEGAIGLKWYLHGAERWAVSDIASPAGHGERIAGLARPLAEFLHGRREPIAAAREGRDVLRLVLACYDSAAAGRRVALG